MMGMNIKNAGIFTKPMLKGRFALSKKPDVKKPIEPIDAITNPIAAELPIALLIAVSYTHLTLPTTPYV